MSLKMIEAIVEELLNEVRRIYTENQQLTDELLSGLNAVLPHVLGPALELVDRRAVHRFVSTSGRTVYQVVGSSGTPYTCFGSSNYCSCPSFKFSVIKKSENYTCKHVLAIRLSEAMDLSGETQVTNELLKNMLCDAE